MAYVFGEYRLDIKRRELRRGDQLVALEPQVLDLLVYLVRHRDRVVSKNDILEGVWAGRIVSDAALATRINAVRRAIGDNGERQLGIRTFPRKGFRFVSKVHETPDESPLLRRHPSSSPGPSIAVLQFADLSADGSQTHLADSAVEQIIAALCRVRWLSVIARSSSFTYRGQAVDAKRVGQELGVHYLLEGSVRKSANRVRITAQLIDAETDEHLWAESYQGPFSEVLVLQSQVARAIAREIDVVLTPDEATHLESARPVKAAAYNAFIIARHLWNRGTGEDLKKSVEYLKEAVEADSGEALRYVGVDPSEQWYRSPIWKGKPSG